MDRINKYITECIGIVANTWTKKVQRYWSSPLWSKIWFKYCKWFSGILTVIDRMSTDFDEVNTHWLATMKSVAMFHQNSLASRSWDNFYRRKFYRLTRSRPPSLHSCLPASLTHSHTHPLTHSPTYSLTHLLTHSLTHSHTLTLTLTLIHWRTTYQSK